MLKARFVELEASPTEAAAMMRRRGYELLQVAGASENWGVGVSEFRAQGVWVLGFRVWGLGFRVSDRL